MAEETEKIYVIPLKKKNYPSSIAAPTAMNRVKQYLIKHMKVEESDIWIDSSLNEEIWKRGKYKMPNKIRVKAVKFDDGVVEAYLPELEFIKSRREIIQEEKAKKQPILLKEEEMESEEGIDTGDEDYDVVPTGDGEVKIKKKKQEKEQTESSDEKEEKSEKKPVADTPKKTRKKPDTSTSKKSEDKPEKKKTSAKKPVKKKTAEAPKKKTTKTTKTKKKTSDTEKKESD